MLEEARFRELIARVRTGDDLAATELVQHYEPEIRRIARVRLSGSSMGRLLDSMDICQSVMANFFLRVAGGQFDLESPQQMLKLLVTMACNKVTDQARRQKAQRRSEQKARNVDPEVMEAVADQAQSPSQVVEQRELLQAARAQLKPDELFLMEQRGLGREWADIARETGESPEALRKRLARALDRVGKVLGLEEVDAD